VTNITIHYIFIHYNILYIGSKDNELFYPSTTDEMPLTFGDFVVVKLTTETTEKISSITLRVTKNQSVSLYIFIRKCFC